MRTRFLRWFTTAAVVAATGGTLIETSPEVANASPGSLHTIPELQEWTPTTGTYTFTESSKIVVDSSYSSDLIDDAETFAADLRQVVGRTVTVTEGSADSGDVYLTLGGSDPDEGYTMDIGDIVHIRASTDTGAFYGTRTMLQLLMQSLSVSGGTAVDAPLKPERGLMIDVGRKYFTVPWLERHIKELAYLKMNRLHLHLSDTYGSRVESTTHPETVSEEHYTKQEIRDLVALGEKYHITIVPELDMPGHMNAILENHPELQLDDTSGNLDPYYLDLSEPEAYTLVEDLIREYIPLFPGADWHMGADEYVRNYDAYPQLLEYARATYGPDATAKDSYYGFINWVNDIVRSEGKTLRIWNDGIKNGDGTIQPATNIHVESWYDYGLSPQALIDRGHTISNQSWTPTYYVLGVGKPDVTWAYETWTPNLFQGGLTIDDASRNLGSNVHVWCDYPDAETEEQVASGIRDILRIVAQQTWGSEKPVPTFAEYTDIINTVGRSPGWLSNSDNLALGRPATASSVETSSLSAVNAVDGEIGTRWSSAYSDPSWIQVDLGEPHQITKVVLNWEVAYGQAYEIQTSSDGTSWTTIFSTTTSDGGVDEIAVDGSGRYVRMYGTKRGTTYGYSLWEFEVYGPASGTITGIGSDRCLDVSAANSSDGTPVILWDCHEGPNQHWVHQGDGTLQSLGKCLQPEGGDTSGGTDVVINTCNGAASQRWEYDPETQSFRVGGKCLDAYGGETANGTRTILWSCHGGSNQRWTEPGT